MRIAAKYSHLNGYEWLRFHHANVWKELMDTIESIDANSFRSKRSKEKTMRGRMLFSPKEINKSIGTRLESAGWQESRTSYWVTDDDRLIRQTLTMSPQDQKQAIEDAGKTPIFSYNQTDFVKDRIAVEVQFGKYACIAYDLFVKHLAFYVGDTIDLGIEVLPMKAMQSEMSSGPGYYEGALYDLVRQGRGVPAVPLILLGVVP